MELALCKRRLPPTSSNASTTPTHKSLYRDLCPGVTFVRVESFVRVSRPLSGPRLLYGFSDLPVFLVFRLSGFPALRAQSRCVYHAVREASRCPALCCAALRVPPKPAQRLTAQSPTPPRCSSRRCWTVVTIANSPPLPTNTAKELQIAATLLGQKIGIRACSRLTGRCVRADTRHTDHRHHDDNDRSSTDESGES